MFECKLEGGEEAGHMGICGKNIPRRLSLVCSRTQGGQSGWSRESEGRAVKGKKKAGLQGMVDPCKDFLAFTLKQRSSCQKRVPWDGLCFNRIILAAVLTSVQTS